MTQETATPTGLSSEQAAALLLEFGPNAITSHPVPLWKRLLRFFWGPIPWMIETAAVLSLMLGDLADFLIIFTMLLVNACVGFWQEFKADNAIKLLQQRLAPQANVLRDGSWQVIPADRLVPGDLIAIGLGSIIAADAILVQGDYLSVDESALTGESLPVDKKIGDVVYSGAVVKQGNMQAQVKATGMQTLFGKTASLVDAASSISHFQRAVLKIGNFLALVALLLVGLIFVVAVFRQEPMLEILQFALILTVAAIPVAMPAVLSVTMAVGASRLAELKAIVTRLSAIEEIAGMDILCADKTGTLTQNQLTPGTALTLETIPSDQVLLYATLTASVSNPDATDQALIKACPEDKRSAYSQLTLLPFDPVSKRAIATIRGPEGVFMVAKGAAQSILELIKATDEVCAQVEAQIQILAKQGMRGLAVAQALDVGLGQEVDQVHWSWMGILPIFDPPREDSASTLRKAEAMGITVKMITGDHVAIAQTIASQLALQGPIISADAVFNISGASHIAQQLEQAAGVAQVFPEHKYQIVRALQADGHVVGMTGDGVNDAPALKQADAGIAVSGATEAARAAATLILTAPGTAVITQAVLEARKIFARMTGYATFRIAETIRVLLFMTLSILVFKFYPLTPVMIVMLALLNDFPIMMIAYDNAAASAKPVRWDMRRVLSLAIALGVSGVCASLLLFWYCYRHLQLPQAEIQTIIFLKLLVAGHLTIYVTRIQDWFWRKPWPSLKLFLVCEVTQILGTLMAVYGFQVTAIGWKAALWVWAYSLTWMLVSALVASWVLAYGRPWGNHGAKA